MITKRENLYALAVLDGYNGPPVHCSDTCDNLVEYYSTVYGHMWCKEHTEIQDIEATHIDQLQSCRHDKLNMDDEDTNDWLPCPFGEEISEDSTPCWCCDECRGDCADDI